MSLFDWFYRLLGYDEKPDWEKHPENYHVCPECEKASANVEWGVQNESDEVSVAEYPLHEAKATYVCPECDSGLDTEAYQEHRLDRALARGNI